MKRLAGLAMLTAAALVSTAAAAQTRIPTNVSAQRLQGTNGNYIVLDDGAYPPNGQYYTTDTVSWSDPAQIFQFGFGPALVSVGSFNLTVDNNDDYDIFFYNGLTAANLVATRTISAVQGVVPASPGGVETFSSSPTLNGTYLANLSFVTPIQARRVIIQARGGDGFYSLGEAEFFTPAAIGGAVPEPAAWTMMIVGFGGIGCAMRRRLKQSASIRFA